MYKRPFDLIILISTHILLFPLLLLLWTVIPLIIWSSDKGSIFYVQIRTGEKGGKFKVRKFRTMVENADQLGPVWTKDKDPRITKFGKILRKTALDELPQTLNIWKGEVSLVGPRALPVKEQEELEKHIPGFNKRLDIKPGLTGYSQVYNTTDEPTVKLEYDLKYIDTMNPFLDIKLLLISLINTILGKWDSREGKSSDSYSNIDN